MRPVYARSGTCIFRFDGRTPPGHPVAIAETGDDAESIVTALNEDIEGHAKAIVRRELARILDLRSGGSGVTADLVP